MEVNYILVLITGLIMGLLSTHIALRKGRDPILWFALGLFFGVIALFILYVLEPFGLGQSDSEEQTVVNEEVKIALQTENWYYLDEKWTSQGPISLEELQRLWKERILVETSYIWCSSFADWQTIEGVPGLYTFLRVSPTSRVG